MAAAGDYLTADAPDSLHTNQAPRSTDRHVFCVLAFKIEPLDRLMLSRQGHRRARLEHDRLIWLTP
jgi:hypothetical protein